MTRPGSWRRRTCPGEADAARAYEPLAPFAGLPVMASLGVSRFGSAHHALGTAALTVGELDRAGSHLGDRDGDAAAAREELVTAAREADARGLPLPDEPEHSARPAPVTIVRAARRAPESPTPPTRS